MTQIVAIKDKVRDFFRKYDPIVNPIVRFIFCVLCFFTVRSLYPYFDLTSRTDVCVLLAVMCAILPDGFLVFVVGAIIAINSFKVSLEAGLAFMLLFMFMYCIYIRFFPKCGMAIMLTLMCIVWKIHFAVPFVVGMFAGVGGAVPAALGVLLYYFSTYVEEVHRLMPKTDAKAIISSFTAQGDDKQQMDGLQFLIDNMIKNKEMFMIMGVLIITILVIGIIYSLSFKYSWFVAFGAGAVANIFSYIYMCFVFGFDADLPLCIKGVLLGLIVALIVRFMKGFLDYNHTEIVQFEDDEYYYYVKAVPKLAVEKKPAVDFSKLTEKARKARAPKKEGAKSEGGKADKAKDGAKGDKADRAPKKDSTKSSEKKKAPAAENAQWADISSEPVMTMDEPPIASVQENTRSGMQMKH